MGVKPGYKQTEVGVIPEEWEACALGDGITLLSGHHILAQNCNTVGNGVPYLTGPADFPAGVISHTKFTDRPATLCKPEDILVTVKGSGAGSLAVADDVYCISRQLMAIRVRGWDKRFVFYTLLENASQFRAASTGLIPGLSRSDISGQLIPLPTLLEQSAIATALSDVDALLGALERLIAKKRDLKQAAMQRLLTGQTRLPGFHGEWEETTLLKLAGGKKELFDDGDWIESEHITSQGVRLVQTGNIGIGRFLEKDDRKYIYEASFASLRCKQLRAGDLLVCRLAEPAGRACVFPDIGEEKIVTSVDVTICRPPCEIVNRTYLANLFSTPEWLRKVSDRSGGTTHKRVSRGALGRIQFELPPLSEQTAIAAVLTDMDAELAALEQRLAKTRNLKQGMMQELLTGRTRLL